MVGFSTIRVGFNTIRLDLAPRSGSGGARARDRSQRVQNKETLSSLNLNRNRRSISKSDSTCAGGGQFCECLLDAKDPYTYGMISHVCGCSQPRRRSRAGAQGQGCGHRPGLAGRADWRDIFIHPLHTYVCILYKYHAILHIYVSYK